HPLLLAARQFGRPVFDAVAQAQIGQDFGGAFDGLGALEAADHLRQHDIFERGEFRQQPVRLVDEADIGAADLGPLDVGQSGSRRAADIDFAVVGAFEQAGDMQQRRFAGARRRYQGDRLSRPQRELGAVEDRQRGCPLRVLALYLVEIDDRYIFRPLLHLSPHSYRSASTGSRRAARQDGYSVARNDSVSAMITTAAVSPKSISAGSLERK